MARIDNFTNFATDVADSIRSMTGKTGKIPASQFDTEIKSIETQEDLDDELNVYNEEVTEQGISIDTIKSMLKGKAAGSGSSEEDLGEYVQDGMIAWFDGEDDIQYEAGYWGVLRSKINKSDYISVASQTFGDVTNNKMIKAKKCLVNNKTFGYRLRQDFYKQGYTIEVVGRIASNTNSSGDTGGWLITMNETGSWGIGVANNNNGNGVVTFVNNDHTADKVVTNFFNKVFGASLFLEKVSARGVAGTPDYCKASVNGSEWFNVKETKARGGSTREGHGILCYYTDTSSSSYMVDGELYCLRIYNRQLTNEELAHNHAIDKARFDTFE